MAAQYHKPETDPVLLPYFEAKGEEAERLELARLITEVARPVIRQALERRGFFVTPEGRSSNPDSEDIYNQAHLQLLDRMPVLKQERQKRAIYNFAGYVARIADNVCNEHLRSQQPQRVRLKERIYYLLTSRPAFSLWEGKSVGWLCGLAEWRYQEAVHEPPHLGAELAHIGWEHTPLDEVLTMVFRAAGGPLQLDYVVTVVAHLTGVRDRPAESFDDPHSKIAMLSDRRPGSEQLAELRADLRRYWNEVCLLAPLQRKALLLSTRDENGRSVVDLLLDASVATLAEIATALGISVEGFYALLPDLPLPDLTIAGQMGTTRQKVINLRKAARKLLEKRLRGDDSRSQRRGK